MIKKVEKTEIIASKLIIDKNEFEKQINDRITKGKELLNFAVEEVSSYYQHNYFINKNEIIVEYDKTEENNFLSEYDKWNNFNIELLKRSFDTPDNEYLHEYKRAEYSVWSDSVKTHKQSIRRQINVFESFIERLSLIPTTKETIRTEIKVETKSTNNIFIVHGHNNEIKQTVARTLTQLKLSPIILHELAEQGRTIIEKFEDNISDVNFAVILLTADDEGKAKNETNYKNRARQNVVFEMGYLIGKLGRQKVFLLLENGVDKPGDLDGIVYVPIDAASGWKLNLVKELKAAGYNVSADDL